jgi:hypothetical protein
MGGDATDDAHQLNKHCVYHRELITIFFWDVTPNIISVNIATFL